MEEDLSLASRLGWEQLVEFQIVNGHKIAVASSEGGNAKPLLLIHGFPSSAWDYYKIWPQLAERGPLIAPDLLGYGLSDKPAKYGYSVAEQADICEALLERSGVSEFDLLSHDYGDSVAQEILARRRDGTLKATLGKTIMLNGGIIPSAYRARPIQKLLAGPLGPLLSHLLTKERFKKSFLPIFGPETQPVEAELNMIWDYITHNDGHRRSHEMLAYMAERTAHEARWVPPILEPDGPLLLINGSLDPISGKHVIDAYRAQGGKADILELPTIGHYPQLEAPQQVLDAALAFLD